MSRSMDDARFVVERSAGFNESAGPWEGGRIGFAIGERVFWTDSYTFPGDTTASHAEKVAYVTDIIMRLNHGRPAARSRRIRAMTASPAPDMPSEEEIADQIDEYLPNFGGSLKAARAILALIRPAFEALDHECQSSMEEIARERARADAAEAKLAQAVEALGPFASALKDNWSKQPDESPIIAGPHAYDMRLEFTLGDFRRARAAATMGEKT